MASCDANESEQSKANRKQPSEPIVEYRKAHTTFPPGRLVRADEAFNDRDMSGAVAHFSPNALLLEKSSNLPPIRGREQIRKKLVNFTTIFPDARITPIRVLGGKNWLLSETRLSGSQEQSIGSLENKKQKFVLHGANLHRVEEDVVVETHVYADAPTVIRQLGGFQQEPIPESTEGKATILSDPPSPQLEKMLQRFVRAWFANDEVQLRHVTAPSVLYRNHIWQHYGDGLKGLLTKASPTSGIQREATIELTRTFSTGEWALAEVLVTVSVDEKTQESETKNKIRTHQLIVARFDQDKVQEVHLYGNSVKIRQALHGPKLFPKNP